MSNSFGYFIKNVFDFTLTAIGTICISPLLVYVAYRIKKESKGDVIYDGGRLGKNGKIFKCYKFRSMYIDGDKILKDYYKEYPEEKMKYAIYHKLENDPRVTPFGYKLRRTSIDELPQIFNVLKGEMSLVGPRPYLESELKEMGDFANTILQVKPGITGYWQVNGRSNIDFESRLLMDCWYVRNRTFWLDFKLLWQTIGVVFMKKGAY